MDLRQAQITLLQKFAHLYDSGVPLAEALEIARGELPEPVHAAVCEIVEDLYRGSSLADAMGRRPDAFSEEVVGIIRAGEQRGELGTAARNAAAGLTGRVITPRRAADAELDVLLEHAGDACFLHLEPDGRLRIRTTEGLSDGGADLDAIALSDALAQRAQLRSGTGTGAFVWHNRLVRIAITSTPRGPSTVVRLSAEPGPEPDEARAWRLGRPGILLVVGGRHADRDGCLRSILAAFDPAATKRVAVDLPVPEALCAPDLASALAQDPDVVCVAHMREASDVAVLANAVEEGIHAAVGVSSERLFRDVPHRALRLP